MLRISFQLRGTAVAVLHQQPAAGPTAPARGGVKIGSPRNDLFRLDQKRDCFFHGRPLATSQNGAQECESGRLQEITTRELSRSKFQEVEASLLPLRSVRPPGARFLHSFPIMIRMAPGHAV